MHAHLRRYLLNILALAATSYIVASAQNATSAVHTVQAGETLYRISRIHNVPLDALLELNPTAREGIRVGDKIILPANAKAVTEYATSSTSPASEGDFRFHTVRPGDTLYSIARAYGVTVPEILKVNSSIKSAESLPGGIILRIPPTSRTGEIAGDSNYSAQKTEGKSKPVAPPVAPTEKVTGLKQITVTPGMTIYRILRISGWSEEDLYKYNPRVRDGLKAGMTILIPDLKLADNKALTNATPIDQSAYGAIPGAVAPNVTSSATVVLALPFSEDGSNTRFRDYYQGLLLKLREAKEKGVSIDLHTVDIGSSLLSSSLSELEELPTIDLIIGGVSPASQTALAALAGRKGAIYVIPFTSTPLTSGVARTTDIYQINTPHNRLYAAAADKFVQVYRGVASHVHFVRYTSGEKDDKGDFVSELKNSLSLNGFTYSEGDSGTLDEDLTRLKAGTGTVVLIPTSSSRSAADNLISAIIRCNDKSEENEVTGSATLTAFGYPEWQTYSSGLSSGLRKTESTFYTTFFAEPSSEDYMKFSREYVSWYGVGVGRTFPRYSILGYDTAGYFLDPESVGNIYKKGRFDGYYDGIQSRFGFRPSSSFSNHFYSNMGVFFVRYKTNDTKTTKL